MRRTAQLVLNCRCGKLSRKVWFQSHTRGIIVFDIAEKGREFSDLSSCDPCDEANIHYLQRIYGINFVLHLKLQAVVVVISTNYFCPDPVLMLAKIDLLNGHWQWSLKFILARTNTYVLLPSRLQQEHTKDPSPSSCYYYHWTMPVNYLKTVWS